MPIFVIERDFPGAEHLSALDLRGIANKACDALQGLGQGLRWIESYVTADRFYCIYEAASAEALREHAKRAGLPANRISAVRGRLGPRGAVDSQARPSREKQ